MKKVLLNIASIMAAIVIINCFVKADNTDETVLAQVLEEDIWYDINSNVESAVYIGNEYLNNTEKEELLKKISSGLEINREYNIEYDRTDTGCSVSLTKNAKRADTLIKITTVERSTGTNKVTLSQYLYVKIEFEEAPDSAAYYKEKLEGILGDMEYDGDVSVNYTGKCAGKLSAEEKNDITTDIMESLHARITDRVCADDIFSVYGYSEYVGDCVMADGKRTNLNLAFSYDEEENATMLHISAPIITADY